MGNEKPKPDEIPTVPAKLLTTTEETMLEFAKQMLLKSTETSLDFHKTMLGTTATFGTLITTIAPILIWGDKDIKIIGNAAWLLLLPSLFMLLSAIAFIMGYYPRYRAFNPNSPADIAAARQDVIRSRALWAFIGVVLFCGSLFALSALTIWLRLTMPGGPD